jgi:YD repeat-containing protein
MAARPTFAAMSNAPKNLTLGLGTLTALAALTGLAVAQPTPAGGMGGMMMPDPGTGGSGAVGSGGMMMPDPGTGGFGAVGSGGMMMPDPGTGGFGAVGSGGMMMPDPGTGGFGAVGSGGMMMPDPGVGGSGITSGGFGGSGAGVDPGTEVPIADASRAPMLQPLAFGGVLASRDYELTLSLGELPGVGLSPGFGAGIRLRTNGADGACGRRCELLVARGEASEGGYAITEANGAVRRFVPASGGFRETAPRTGIVFEPATAALDGGELVVSEPGGRLSRRFDAAGREIAQVTPWGALSLAYDGDGRLVRAENAAGAALVLAYDDEGRVAMATDATGFTTTLRYSFDDHLVAVEGPPDGDYIPPSIQVQWFGDFIGGVGRIGLRGVQLQYEDGKVVYAQDAEGEAYAFRSSAADLEIIDSSHRYTRIEFDGEDVSSVESSDGGLVRYERDELGRLVETRTATGGADLVETLAYDADNRVVSATDAKGNTTTYSYDSNGNLVAVTDPFGRTTAYGYNAQRLRTSETDALGRTATTAYDANGLPTSSSFLGVTTSQTYDARGNVATSTDAFGVVTQYHYDAHGRLESVEVAGEPPLEIERVATADGETITVTKGDDSYTTEKDAYGRVVSQSSSNGAELEVGYDPMTGLATSQRREFRGAVDTTSMSLTNTGSPSQVWENGRLRQSGPRVVPPGSAWFDFGGTGMEP